MRFKTFNAEVLFADEPVVTVDKGWIDFLKAKALGNERKRIRLCTHKDLHDSVHEMFIIHTKHTYVRPHKHLRGESFHLIDGCADVVLFDEVGEIAEIIRLGDYASGHTFYYRLFDPCYHTLIVRSDVVVFHEAKQGPFTPSETTFAPWAPDWNESAPQRDYMNQLAHAVKAFLLQREEHP